MKETQTHAQLELIPGLLAGVFLLSPGAPVNNCRWASIQWTWDQCRKSDPGTYTDPWSLNEALHCSYDDWLQGPGISSADSAAGRSFNRDHNHHTPPGAHASGGTGHRPQATSNKQQAPSC